jgi:hypothetical protein
LKLLTVWRKRKRSWGRDHLSLNLLVANPFLQRLSGVSKQMRDRTLPIFTWLKACACVVESLKSQCCHFWKNTLQWRKHTPLQVFKNKYSTFQNLFLNVWTPVCIYKVSKPGNNEIHC